MKQWWRYIRLGVRTNIPIPSYVCYPKHRHRFKSTERFYRKLKHFHESLIKLTNKLAAEAKSHES